MNRRGNPPGGGYALRLALSSMPLPVTIYVPAGDTQQTRITKTAHRHQRAGTGNEPTPEEAGGFVPYGRWKMSTPTTREHAEYLTSAQARKLLGIKPQTLYAYVSRGWIRSMPGNAPNRRLYLRADIESVKVRSDARRGHAAVAAAAMRHGQPILESSITAITPEGPLYRGVLAGDFVRRGYLFEQVAEWLWSGSTEELERKWPPIEATSPLLTAPRSQERKAHRDLVHWLAVRALDEPNTDPVDASPAAEIDAGRHAIRLLASSIGHWYGRPPQSWDKTSIAALITTALGAKPTVATIHAINACLILAADHELSQCTFVARVAASAEADLGSCISASILTQGGIRSRRSQETEDFLRRVAARPKAALHEELAALRREQRFPPGFGNPLYPDRDPRVEQLIGLVKKMDVQSRLAERLYNVLDVAANEFEFYPTLDAARGTMSAALGLPRESTVALYLLARSAGWVAHVIEQRGLHVPLRPRASYVPRQPEKEAAPVLETESRL